MIDILKNVFYRKGRKDCPKVAMRKVFHSKIMRLIAISIALQVAAVISTNAQTAPPWVNGEFPPVMGAYDFMLSRGEGETLRAARNDAFNSFLTDLGNNAGVRVSSRTIAEIKRKLSYQGDITNYNEGESSSTVYEIEREGFYASFIKVAEYYERIQTRYGFEYRLWELYEVSERGSFRPYIPQYTTRYGAAGFFRSALLPGWGQLYKGSRTKGVCIIGGEALLIGGIVATESLRASYIKMINETHSAEQIRAYSRDADTMENFRNVCITAAAALYLYNLIDAIAAPGAPHLIPSRSATRRYAFYPSFSTSSTSINLVMNF
jgi:hypothetical protein